MSAPNGLPGIMVSIVLGVVFVPTIVTWTEEENYIGVALLGIGALVIFILIFWFFYRIVKHLFNK